MAIAHICLDCGWDLARTRPRLEPHYGLNIIQCPRCDGASVRRAHPLKNGWKTLRRVDWALTVLAVQVILFAAATVATVLSVFALVVASTMLITGRSGSDIGWFFFVPLVIAAPLVGAWLTAGLGHHRRWLVWTAWIAWSTLVMFVVLVTPFVVTGQFAIEEFELNTITTAQIAVVSVALVLMVWTAGLLTFMLVAASGIPLGVAFLWLAARARTQQWRWRRRQKRNALVAG